MSTSEESQQFLDDENYRVTYLVGASGTAILAFGGVGLALGGIQVEEFRKSLGSRNTIFFLTDKHRSWWNNGDILQVIERIVSFASKELNVTTLAAVGNSMGGSGALLAAHYFSEITRGLSLVPQGDVRTQYWIETRWLPYRRKIRSFKFKNFALLPRSSDFHILFGDRSDTWQKRIFRGHDIELRILRGYDHRLAAVAKIQRPAFYRSMIDFVTDGVPINFDTSDLPKS